MSEEFAGFKPPTKNYFPMPNEWIDICARIDNLAELKIIQYVLRHTWGYREFGITKTITIEEFMHGRKRNDGTRMDSGTGLKSDRSVKDGIKQALSHGYLICEVDDSDRARIKKSYALKASPMQSDGYNLPIETRQVDTTYQMGDNYPSDMQHLPIRGAETTYRSEKDTLERHLEKDTLERQERVSASAPTPSSSLNHDTSMPHNEVSCALWQRCNKKSCADFQAAIDANHISEADLLQLLASYEDEQEREMHRLANAYEPQGANHASPPPVLPDRAPALDRVPGGEPEVTQPVPIEGENHGRAYHSHHSDSPIPHLPDTAEHQERATPPQRGHVRDTPGAHGRGAAHPQQMTSDLPPTDGAATERGSAPRASEAKEKPETAKQQKARIEHRKSEIIALYCELLGRKKIVLSKDNLEGSKLLAEAEATDEEISLTYNAYKDHSFWGRQLHLKNIAKLLDTTVPRHTPVASTSPPANQERRSDFDVYVGNGPEARRQLVEEGHRLKALGFYPDL